MQSQWTAISEQSGQGWIAYYRELPQAVAPGNTRGEAIEHLQTAVDMILNAGVGGADIFGYADDNATETAVA